MNRFSWVGINQFKIPYRYSFLKQESMLRLVFRLLLVFKIQKPARVCFFYSVDKTDDCLYFFYERDNH